MLMLSAYFVPIQFSKITVLLILFHVLNWNKVHKPMAQVYLLNSSQTYQLKCMRKLSWPICEIFLQGQKVCQKQNRHMRCHQPYREFLKEFWNQLYENLIFRAFTHIAIAPAAFALTSGSESDSNSTSFGTASTSTAKFLPSKGTLRRAEIIQICLCYCIWVLVQPKLQSQIFSS